MHPDSWTNLLQLHFPELDPEDPDPLGSLALRTDQAHQAGDEAFLNRCYTFIRWAVRNIADDSTKAQIAWFFDLILQLDHSKASCVDHLDWGDVELLTDTFAVEPSFTDTENFEGICREWRKRWARNRKLPEPKLPEKPGERRK